MAIYVYRKTDGGLVSWCQGDSDPVAADADLSAKGLIAVRGLPALDDAHAWDAVTKTVIAVAAPVVPRPMATGKWILRFTPDEFDAISSSGDKIVKLFLYALNHTTEVDLSDPSVVQGVNYLASISLIQPARVAEIMA